MRTLSGRELIEPKGMDGWLMTTKLPTQPWSFPMTDEMLVPSGLFYSKLALRSSVSPANPMMRAAHLVDGARPLEQ